MKIIYNNLYVHFRLYTEHHTVTIDNQLFIVNGHADSETYCVITRSQFYAFAYLCFVHWRSISLFTRRVYQLSTSHAFHIIVKALATGSANWPAKQRDTQPEDHFRIAAG